VLELEAVDGLLRFEVTGDGGFSLLTHFGTSDLPDEPDATLRMTAAAYADLRAGRIDPQSAFLDDAIETEGDMQKIMQVAFAVVAPD
jgi:putative sterol carrier protein